MRAIFKRGLIDERGLERSFAPVVGMEPRLDDHEAPVPTAAAKRAIVVRNSASSAT